MSEPFDEIWRELLSIVHSEEKIPTLVQKNVNLIWSDNNKIIVQSVITGNPRYLTKDDFQLAWHKLVELGKLELNDIDPELRGRRSIIFAILERLPNVCYKEKPLTLFLK